MGRGAGRGVGREGGGRGGEPFEDDLFVFFEGVAFDS